MKSTSNNDNQSNKFLINEGDINKKDVTLNSNINISNKNNNEFSKTLSTFSSASAHSDNEFIQDIQTDKRNDQLEQNQHGQVQFKQIILTWKYLIIFSLKKLKNICFFLVCMSMKKLPDFNT